MRKIWILAFSLLIFLFSFNISLAQVSEVQKVNYELPYPGLLPDSPLYIFRIIRDRVVSLLISDPLKKAEFNLLQADKRLNAGIYLFDSSKKDEKKINLTISTISKAENYFEEAIQKVKEAGRQGMEIKEITEKLINSAKKHSQELEELAKRTTGSFKANLGTELRRAIGFQKEINSLSSKE